ncbi:MAG: hypothetical protein HY960_05175 [Ignavibacteriae bacterium]|nr:hypothetical protein [Ignavibacteriota bacterium]
MLFVFITIYAVRLSAQELSLRFQRLTEKEGMSHAYCTTIVQDSTGFLWFGTFNGLNRYDGQSFRVFSHDPRVTNSIPANNVRLLFIDSKKRMIVGTPKGATIYDESTRSFRPFRLKGENSLDTTVTASEMIEDRLENLWITNSQGLMRVSPTMDAQKWFRYSEEDSQTLSDNRITSLCVDSYGILWVGTNNGVNRYDAATETFKRYYATKENGTISNSIITCIYEDKRGTLYVGTNGSGFNEYLREQDAFRRFMIETGNKGNPYNLSSNAITSMFEDNEGVFWIGSEDGLMIFNREQKRCSIVKNNPTDERSLLHNSILLITEDRSHNVWIATARGVCKYIRRPKGFDYLFDASPSTYEGTNLIMEVCTNYEGKLFIGTRGAGLRSYNPKTGMFDQYPAGYGSPEALSSTIAWSVIEDKDSTLWVGTAWGLNTLKKGKQTFERFDPNDKAYPLPGTNIGSIIQDHTGVLWFGTENGIASYDSKTQQWKCWTKDASGNEKLPGKVVNGLYEDSERRLWAGAGDRLCLYDRSTHSFIDYVEQSKCNVKFGISLITWITESSRGTLLIGTDFGVVEFDTRTNSATYLMKEDGLPDNIITTILEDADHNVWITTPKGLALWERESKTLTTFKEEDGLDEGRFGSRAVATDNNGTIYYGTTNGIIVVRPSEVQKNQHIPKVVFTSFKKFNKEALLEPDIALRQNLELQYDDYVLSFEFAALEFTGARENQFMYKLEGFDNEWVNNGHENLITYTNLDPGNYTLRVKASNNDGVWNEQGASLAIVILPPFWMTWWFITLSVLVVGGTAFGLVRSRYVHLQKAKHEREVFSHRLMEQTEEERKRIASELHDSIGQQLLIIKNTSELGVRKSKALEDALKRFHDISSISESTVKQLREISHNLRPTEIDRFGVWQAIKTLVSRIEATSALRFVVNIGVTDSGFSKETEMHIFRIVQESVNNIIKHSDATEATLTVSKTDGSIALTITDNGKGFTVLVGDGIGLSSMHTRARAINAQFSIKTNSGSGTRIQLILPAPIKEEKL